MINTLLSKGSLLIRIKGRLLLKLWWLFRLLKWKIWKNFPKDGTWRSGMVSSKAQGGWTSWIPENKLNKEDQVNSLLPVLRYKKVRVKIWTKQQKHSTLLHNWSSISRLDKSKTQLLLLKLKQAETTTAVPQPSQQQLPPTTVCKSKQKCRGAQKQFWS